MARLFARHPTDVVKRDTQHLNFIFRRLGAALDDLRCGSTIIIGKFLAMIWQYVSRDL